MFQFQSSMNKKHQFIIICLDTNLKLWDLNNRLYLLDKSDHACQINENAVSKDFGTGTFNDSLLYSHVRSIKELNFLLGKQCNGL